MAVSCMIRFILGRSRYQLFELPVVFTLMRSFSTITELFYKYLWFHGCTFFYSKGVFGVDITHFVSDRLTEGTTNWYKLIFGNEQVKCIIKNILGCTCFYSVIKDMDMDNY